ncbi:MAG: cytochrome c3 family protein [Paracoccaceae bacterium]
MRLFPARPRKSGQSLREAARTCAAVLALALAAFLSLAWIAATPAAAQETVTGVQQIEGFDHSAVGIPLTGKHAEIICESCHIDNKLKGTPRDCVSCHNGSIAKGKPASHPPAGNTCSQCHTTKNFRPFAFDHAAINQPCATCHNGAKARSKPANHIPATDTCDNCHVTAGFKDARVDHRDVKGTCVSCHNGSAAPGKKEGHIQAPDDCGTCHSTLTFKNPAVNHASIGQPCASCHSGSVTTVNPTDRQPPDWHRVVEMNDCETCHIPGASFAGAFMDHSRAAFNTDCVACHFVFSGPQVPNPNESSRTTHDPGEDCSGCHGLP